VRRRQRETLKVIRLPGSGVIGGRDVLSETPPAERVASGGPPQRGAQAGESPTEIFFTYRILIPLDGFQWLLVLGYISLWSLRSTQPC
jgi:hypothetical protein